MALLALSSCRHCQPRGRRAIEMRIAVPWIELQRHRSPASRPSSSKNPRCSVFRVLAIRVLGEGMANQGAKKRKEENEKHIQWLRNLILVSNAIHILVRILLLRSSVSWRHFFRLLLSSAAYKLSYSQLQKMAQPSFDERGDLIDGGFDMSTGGLCSYLHDIIYITSFVQVSSVFSDYFWYLYWVIPLFALYKLWQLVLYPFVFQSSPQDAGEDEKARKKKEKKANKVKFSRVKTR
ncbi:transmembrane protein 208 [Selaginella moellendorffii]|uniref:transmembrane protein 208 n=1 Tax=Selaginella moellendorffii TaxID=88036 RepID=UPI000D1C8C71|nr:transmembrane protein 208 [Selaginella moellendorffii]XP_024518046.1 transmembrane protein 208 [Selaginella moellendorffii]|eukprot:XP_024518045.1 transmembrane protein 208 [Selaginella moellendorffii]